MRGSAPLVSIVTAAYNRADVLRFALESARQQRVQDFEHLVIGDACTDHSSDVVASFGDPRLEFHNLARNVGEQSGPNNEGCRRARGQYVAFLNQDDLWFDDHLEACVAHIERTQADLVFSMGLAPLPEGGSALLGATAGGRYAPYFWVPASLWLMKRALFDEVGPWSFYRDCRLIPSQDWLVRAWRQGKRLEPLSRVTVVAIQSGRRPGSYVRHESGEHARWLAEMRADARLREREITAAALALFDETRSTGVWRHLRRALGRLVFRLAGIFGIAPVELSSRLVHPRRGQVIDELRRVRGLPPLP